MTKRHTKSSISGQKQNAKIARAPRVVVERKKKSAARGEWWRRMLVGGKKKNRPGATESDDDDDDDDDEWWRTRRKRKKEKKSERINVCHMVKIFLPFDPVGERAGGGVPFVHAGPEREQVFSHRASHTTAGGATRVEGRRQKEKRRKK